MRVPVNIVTPGEAQRVEVVEVMATALNFPRERAMKRAPTFPLDDIRVAVEDDRIVAVAAEFRFDQWFAGRPIDCSGIWGVGTLPEHRAGGLATACTRALLDRARERGTPLTALFPALLTPYRRLGYEIAGTFERHQVSLDALPPGDDTLPPVELVDPERDVAAVRVAFREWVSTATGPFEPTSDEHWLRRVLERADDDSFRAVVVREDARITGVAAFSRSPDPGPLDIAFGIDCGLLFAITPQAQRALWAYLRGYRGLGKWVRWAGPPNDPLALASLDTFLERPYRHDWMMRLLDLPAALAARGYPPVDADLTIAVEDDLYPDNAGAWRVAVRGGDATVGRVADHDRRPLAIGVLSAMFTGSLRASTAVVLGHLDADDPAVNALATIFDGPDPWSPFFF